jgi:hypothetical protein
MFSGLERDELNHGESCEVREGLNTGPDAISQHQLTMALSKMVSTTLFSTPLVKTTVFRR